MDSDDSGWDADWEAESRASSVAPMPVHARCHPGQGHDEGGMAVDADGPATSESTMAHPPMVYAPAAHPPLLPAEAARAMEATKEALRVAALVEDECLARRRRLSESHPRRLRRYNPDYLLAARRWHTLRRPASKHAEHERETDAERSSACQHCLTSIDSHPPPYHNPLAPKPPPTPAHPLSSLAAPPPPYDARSPPSPAYTPTTPADWEAVYAHLAKHRATLAHLQRAAADAEHALLGAWALVDELVLPVLRQRAVPRDIPVAARCVG
ncbi:uncharacterized protein C8Q71DRAFT_451871 [Rhodofomes roseus]|uniref:Uncharacterized protein n=1 Tax=Rhodofomes roseus TaxID=34475 RepID=A0ABQ8JXN1_9APHY|nr:uncharacterized protein C8Q71DRAFT_451871 [Rhodofomes roseus]KAH9828952.1 hypothetical protein C8Q71DRAFT_451871 [Rhodofomes roseus]